jgi:zinc protease
MKKITLARCTNYYNTYFRPNVAYMAIVGDITAAEVKPMIEKHFGKWEKKDVPVTQYTIPALSATKLTKVAFAPRTAAVQSVVSVTYPIDMKPNNPDVIKARVASTVLGGGSQGRLFLNLREKHAWTYGAYASIKEDELGGSFSATVKCRNVVSDSAVGEILNEMRSMQTDKVSDTTLQSCITYLSGNFAIGLEDPRRVAQYAINIERYNMPKDFYRNYLKNLSAVNADDVIAVSRKYIRPDNANIVVAGSKEEVAAKLAKFSADGKVDFYSYDGKQIEASETKAAPAGVTADAIFQKYIAAMGGEKAWNSVKDIKIVSSSEMQGMPLTITEVKKAPNMWMQSIDVSMGGAKPMTVQKQAYNGKTGYQEQQGRKSDLAGDDLEDVKEDADWTGELHPEKYGVKRTLKGVEAVNGSDAYIVDVVNAKGKKSVEYYDQKTSLLVRKIQGEGEKMQSSEYKDYREVPGTNGYKIPYQVVESMGGQSFSATVKSVEVNKGIPDTDFN